jgi:CDGSH-type Zn-finger protein/uncharacterized Fe-S cluster protein YjdI
MSVTSFALPPPSSLHTQAPSREWLLHALYEAAELEHNLMCTYLYAAFSLKSAGEGLRADEEAAVIRWRRSIIEVAVEEMSHLAAVWNITAALGGTPRFGRGNFPLDPGLLPAGVTVKLAPFNQATLQHFVFLERPHGSDEKDGEGFAPERQFVRGAIAQRLVPMAVDYDTVGTFYATLGDGIQRFVDVHGDDATFCGDRGLQLSEHELTLAGAKRVICLKTALSAFDQIVVQGEGATASGAANQESHYQRFAAIREEYAALLRANPAFVPAHPAATNPVLRRPPKPEGRVWVEDQHAAAIVDAANACYALMCRMLAHAYAVAGPSDEKSLTVDVAISLMRAVTHLGEEAARLPASPIGASNTNCNAGMSFTALRDGSPLPAGVGARRFIVERLEEISYAVNALPQSPRVEAARTHCAALVARAKRGYSFAPDAVAASSRAVSIPVVSATQPSATMSDDGIETVEGAALTLMFEAKRCIHARFCVTGAPTVFLANVKGPWLHPDTMDVERLVDIAHQCPSGAIRYARKDGRPDEAPPPVNLISVRESGPYAVRAAITLDGEAIGNRATLCRCGASKNKPFCDGSHHDIHFSASGEPETGMSERSTDMLPVRNGTLAITPEIDGPLNVRGNVEVLAGTGRMVCRITQAKLCRCGGSATKPFCDGTHAKIGFKST